MVSYMARARFGTPGALLRGALAEDALAPDPAKAAPNPAALFFATRQGRKRGEIPAFVQRERCEGRKGRKAAFSASNCLHDPMTRFEFPVRKSAPGGIDPYRGKPAPGRIGGEHLFTEKGRRLRRL